MRKIKEYFSRFKKYAFFALLALSGYIGVTVAKIIERRFESFVDAVLGTLVAYFIYLVFFIA